MKKAIKNAGVDDSNLDVEQLGMELDGVGDCEDDRDDGDENDNVEFDVGDTVGKALTLVMQAGSLFISLETPLNYKIVLTGMKVATSMHIFSTHLVFACPVQSGLVFGPQNRQSATATSLNWLQLVATSISKKQLKMVENG